MNDDALRYIEALESCPLFRDMEASAIGDILAGFPYRMTEYKRGDLLAIAGTPCRYADIVVEGTLACRMSSPAGKEVEMSRLGPGRMIAPAFIFATRAGMPVTVQAAMPTIVLRWQKDTFRRLLYGNPRVLANFITLLSDTNAFLTHKLNMLSLMTAREKVISLIMQRAREQQSRRIVRYRSRQEIADSMGIQRFSLMRVLADLEKEGAIRVDGRNIDIVDRSRLR